MSIRCRAVASADLPAVQALIQASFDPALQPYMIATQAGAEAFLRVFVDHSRLYPERRFMLSETESGEVVGYAEFRLIDSSMGFLSYICVAPSARGQGVATRLIRTYLQETPQAVVMQLDVFTSNEPALALYKKLGFVSGDQNIWWLRDLVALTKPKNLNITQLPTALASLDKYGFCELTGTFLDVPFRLGIMGKKVLRCFDKQHFLNDSLLASIASVFPELSEALAILPATIHAPDLLAREINRSVRMTWNVSPIP